MHRRALLLTSEDFKTTRWSGGSTTQIRICPPGADYAERDFLWRVSSAVVEDAFSTFTPLPDYHRLIATLEGTVTLRHDGGTPLRLAPFQVHAFDGGAATTSKGRCRDFNLMLRKGKAEGSLQAVLLAPGETVRLQPEEYAEEMLVFCAEGSCALSAGEDKLDLREQEAVVLFDPAEPVDLSSKAGARLMAAQMGKHLSAGQ